MGKDDSGTGPGRIRSAGDDALCRARPDNPRTTRG